MASIYNLSGPANAEFSNNWQSKFFQSREPDPRWLQAPTASTAVAPRPFPTFSYGGTETAPAPQAPQRFSSSNAPSENPGGSWENFLKESAGVTAGQQPATTGAVAPRPPIKTIGDTMKELGFAPQGAAPTAPAPTPSSEPAPRPSLFGDVDIGALFKEWLNPTTGAGGSSAASGSSRTVSPWATQGAGLLTGSLNANTGQLNQALEANRVRYKNMKDDAIMRSGGFEGPENDLLQQITREEADSAAKIQQQFANQQQGAQANVGSRLMSAGQQESQFQAAADRADAADRATKFNQLMGMLEAETSQGNRAEDVGFRNTQAGLAQSNRERELAVNQMNLENQLATAEERYQNSQKTAADDRAYNRARDKYQDEKSRLAFETARDDRANAPQQLVQIGDGPGSTKRGGDRGGGGQGQVYDGSSWTGGQNGGYVGLGGATSPRSRTFSGSNQSQYVSDSTQRARNQLLNNLVSPTRYSG